MNKSIFFLVFSIFLLFNTSVFARDILFGDEIEQLSIVYGEETILRFPGQVKTVSNVTDFDIGPVDKADPDYSLLAVRPIFRKSTGKVLFVLDSGEIIRVKFRTVKSGLPSQVDSLYEFTSKKSVVDKTQNLASISELELMKAMIRNDHVTGYNLRNLKRTVWNTDKKIKVELVKIYTGKRFNGHIFRVENRSGKDAIHIDLDKIYLGKPNQAIMAQIDDNIIYPKSMGKAVTYLRVVAKPTTVYSDLRLPFATKSEKNNE